MKCPECNEELEKGAKFCGNCGVDIEVALSERVKKEAKNREQEEKKLKEKLKENNQNSKQIDEEDKIVDPEVDEEIKKIKEEFIKNEEREIPKFIEENKNETLEQKPKFQKKNEKTKVKKHNYGKIFIVLIILIVLIFGIVYQLHRMNILPESINNVVSPVFEKLDDIFSTNKDTFLEIDINPLNL